MNEKDLKTAVVFSIKPKNAKLIYEKKKTWEFRKVIPFSERLIPEYLKYVLLYETYPVKRITGYFIADYPGPLIEGFPKEIWRKTSEKGKPGMSVHEFFDYCEWEKTCWIYAIPIKDTFQFQTSLNPVNLGWWRKPPQNFQYVKKEWIKTILNEIENPEGRSNDGTTELD